MVDVTVREATPSDVEAIHAIAERSWRAAYGFLPADVIDAAMDAWYDPEDTRAAIEREDVIYLVAVADGVIGYLSGGPSDEEGRAYLAAIYVDPSAWGDGAGTALLEAFDARCAERGYERMGLTVLAQNEVGISFYKSRDFEFVEEREGTLFGENILEREYVRPIGDG